MYRSKKQAVLLFSTHLLSTDRSKEEKKKMEKGCQKYKWTGSFKAWPGYNLEECTTAKDTKCINASLLYVGGTG